MIIQLEIFDSIMGFRAHMIEKNRSLVGVYYQLQNNGAVLFHCLSNGHTFLDPDLDKVWSLNLSYSYFLIILFNTTLIQPNKQQFTALIIVLSIMACFFSGIDSYGFGQKTHTSRFFSFLSGEIVVVIYSMLAVAIKDLALKRNNKELVIRKNAVWFKPSNQKKLTGIQNLAIPTRLGINQLGTHNRKLYLKRQNLGKKSSQQK